MLRVGTYREADDAAEALRRPRRRVFWAACDAEVASAWQVHQQVRKAKQEAPPEAA